MYDVTSSKSFQGLDQWVNEASKYGATSCVISVCGNKVRINIQPIIRSMTKPKNLSVLQKQQNGQKAEAITIMKFQQRKVQ